MPFVAFGLLLALGVALLGWGLAHQVGEPPAPVSAPHTTGAGQPADEQDPPAATEPTAGVTAPTAEPDAPGRSTSRADTAPTTRAPDSSRPAAAEQPEPLPASEPVAVSIPAIGVQSPLHALGLDDEGRLEVPSGDRYDQAAWYAGSPTPGEVGPAVIEGHVTSQGSVPSVFFELGALVPGDLVEVDRADGTTAVFEVYGAESFPKDAFPKATVYGNTGGAELRLITCGGTYDPERRAHLDNIVVFARLVHPAPGR